MKVKLGLNMKLEEWKIETWVLGLGTIVLLQIK